MSKSVYVRTVPEEVRAAFETGHFGAIYDHRGKRETQRVARRLVTDIRMVEVWRRLAKLEPIRGPGAQGPSNASLMFLACVCTFDMDLYPESWQSLSQARREAWLTRTEKVGNELLRLIQDGPPIAKAFPRHVIDSFLNALGGGDRDPGPAAPNRTDPVRSVNSLVAVDAWRAHGMDIPEVVSHYLDEARWAVETFPQALKKPNDPNARRARLLIALTARAQELYGKPLQSTVAAMGEVAFDDPSINVRLVRRLTTGK
jgi:hypothetical protein